MSPQVVGAVAFRQIVVTLIFALASYVLAPKPKKFARQPPELLSTPSGGAPWKVIYGAERVGGTVVFQHRSGAYLWLVVVLAGHRCKDVTTVWKNDKAVQHGGTPVELDPSLFWTAWSSGAANGSYSETQTWAGVPNGNVKVWKYLGTQTAANEELDTASDWTPAAKIEGRTYVIVRVRDDPRLFPAGLPNFTFVVEGKDDIYDPRDDTYKYTTNPALVLADYLHDPAFGMGVGTITAGEYTKIDDATLVATANVCEEQVNRNFTYPELTGTMDRYSCNGTFEVEGTHEETIQHLLTAMGGRAVYSGGQWFIHAAAHTAPVGTITADDLVGSVEILPRFSRAEIFNRVKGQFRSVAHKHIPTDYPVVASATYEAQDGKQLTREMDLAFTNDPAVAQRLAKIELEDSRQQIVVVVRCRLSAYKYRPWDRVNVTLPRYGWDAKLFRVVETRLVQEASGVGPALIIELKLKETSAAIYDWNSATEEAEMDLNLDTTLLDLTEPLGAVQGLVIGKEMERTNSDGLRQRFARVDWTEPAEPAGLAYYEVRWRVGGPANADDWSVARVSSDTTMLVIGPLDSEHQYRIEVTPFSVNQLRGTLSFITYDPPPVTSDYIARIGGRPALTQRLSVFDDQFPDTTIAWTKLGGSATAAIVTGLDTTLGTALSLPTDWDGVSDDLIPFDPSLMYSMITRVRRRAGSPGNLSFGILGYAADGSTMVSKAGADAYTNAHYFGGEAIDMAAWAIDDWITLRGTFYGWGASVGDELGSVPNDPGEVHPDVRYFSPLLIVGDGDVEVDAVKITAVDADGSARVYSTLSTVQGGLLSGTKYQRLLDTAPVARGVQQGVAQDGDAVVFSPAYDAGHVPILTLIPEDVKTHESTWLAGLDQRVIIRADNLTESGFTLYARVAQLSAATTARSATLSEVSPPVNVAGDTVTATKTETPEAIDDVYKFLYDVYLDEARPYGKGGGLIPAAVTLQFQARPSGGAWNTYATKSYVNTDTSNPVTWTGEITAITVDGLAANAEFRILILSAAFCIKIEGTDVSWLEATGGYTSVTATPDADNKVRWVAVEGS